MNWYYLNGKTCHGPVPENDLLTLFEHGEIENITQISREGTDEWISFESQFGRICEDKREGSDHPEPTSPRATAATTVLSRSVLTGRIIVGDFYRMGSAVYLLSRLLLKRHVDLNLAFHKYGRICRESGDNHLAREQEKSQMPGTDASPEVGVKEAGRGHPWWIQARARFRLAVVWLREQIALIHLGKATFARTAEAAEKPPGFERISTVRSELVLLKNRLQSVTTSLRWFKDGRPTLHLASASLAGLAAFCLILMVYRSGSSGRDEGEFSSMSDSGPQANESATPNPRYDPARSNTDASDDQPSDARSHQGLWRYRAKMPPEIRTMSTRGPILTEQELKELEPYVGDLQTFTVTRRLDTDPNFSALKRFGGQAYEINDGRDLYILITDYTTIESRGQADMWILEIDKFDATTEGGFEKKVTVFRQAPQWAVKLMERHLHAKAEALAMEIKEKGKRGEAERQIKMREEEEKHKRASEEQTRKKEEEERNRLARIDAEKKLEQQKKDEEKKAFNEAQKAVGEYAACKLEPVVKVPQIRLSKGLIAKGFKASVTAPEGEDLLVAAKEGNWLKIVTTLYREPNYWAGKEEFVVDEAFDRLKGNCLAQVVVQSPNVKLDDSNKYTVGTNATIAAIVLPRRIEDSFRMKDKAVEFDKPRLESPMTTSTDKVHWKFDVHPDGNGVTHRAVLGTAILYFEATEEFEKELETELDRYAEKTQTIHDKMSMGDFSEDAARTEIQKIAREFAAFITTRIEGGH